MNCTCSLYWTDADNLNPYHGEPTGLVIPVRSFQDILHFFLHADTVFISEGESRLERISVKDPFTLGRGGVDMAIVILYIAWSAIDW